MRRLNFLFVVLCWIGAMMLFFAPYPIKMLGLLLAIASVLALYLAISRQWRGNG